MAGWLLPVPSARKWHFFAADSARSACGKYGRMAFQEVNPDEGSNPNDCVACTRNKAAK